MLVNIGILFRGFKLDLLASTNTIRVTMDCHSPIWPVSVLIMVAAVPSGRHRVTSKQRLSAVLIGFDTGQTGNKSREFRVSEVALSF